MKFATIFIAIIIAFAGYASADQSGLNDLAVTDLWDVPHRLGEISAGRVLVIYFCKPEVEECREGAVYFDSQATRITAAGAKPICVFTGSPERIRDLALNLDLEIPIYVDSGLIYQQVLEQKIVPAIIVFDRSGQKTIILYGGGESLATNLDSILGKISPHSRSYILVVVIALIGTALILFELK